jgi:hypothetical protein
VKRLRPAQVRPLEIWNAEVRGRTLFDWQTSEHFPQVLAEVVQGLRAEYRFEHVHLLGGAALRPFVAEALRATVAEDPVFAAARAGAELAPACADVGQTAIKLVMQGREWLRPRNQQRPAVDFIAGALAELSGPCLLALPCVLEDDLKLTDCSYDWLADDLRPMLRKAGLDDERALIMNDAELAAVASMSDPQVPLDKRTLVLTLGFGVGAALLR